MQSYTIIILFKPLFFLFTFISFSRLFFTLLFHSSFTYLPSSCHSSLLPSLSFLTIPLVSPSPSSHPLFSYLLSPSFLSPLSLTSSNTLLFYPPSSLLPPLFSINVTVGSLLLACAFLGADVIGSDIDGDCLGLAPTDVPLKVYQPCLVLPCLT